MQANSETVRVKICGITNIDDALVAARAGADFLGYILYPKSKRYIAHDAIRPITDAVRAKFPHIRHIGVVVDDPLDVVTGAVGTGGLDLVQLHGNESAEYAAQLSRGGVRYLRAMRFGPGAPPMTWSDYPGAEYYLCDTFDINLAGGSGKGFDPAFLPPDLPRTRMFLAGGLIPENVAQAVAEVCPFAVDVASGVEASPGLKDHAKVEAFIHAAKGL